MYRGSSENQPVSVDHCPASATAQHCSLAPHLDVGSGLLMTSADSESSGLMGNDLNWICVHVVGAFAEVDVAAVDHGYSMVK